MKLMFCSLLTTLILLFGCQNITNTTLSEEDIYEDYLLNNHKVIDLLTYNPSDFHLLDHSMDNTDIIFIGEIHEVKYNHYIQVNLIKYLHEYYDLRYLVFERSYSYGFLVNQYFKTGDLYWIENMKTNQQSYDLIKAIYDFNKTLDNYEKLLFLGVDIERDLRITAQHLEKILPDKEPSQSIKDQIDAVKDMIKYSSIKTVSSVYLNCVDILESISENREDYEDFFGEYFDGFSRAINALVVSNKQFQSRKIQLRDNLMFKNFKELYDQLPEGLYYANFGRYHTLQKTFDETENPFATLLNKSDLNIKLLTVALVYNNCFSHHRRAMSIVEDFDPNFKLFDIIDKQDAIMIDLVAENSPFEDNLIWPYLDNVPDITEIDKTTSYFQYIIVISDSPE